VFDVDTPQAPGIISGRPYSLDQIIEMQREFRRTGQFRPLGRLMTAIFERLEGEKCPEPGTDVWGRSLEFGDGGPLIGLSADGFQLIVRDAFPLVLPDTPDPQAESPATAPRLKQRYADRSDKYLRGGEFVIFEPLYQFLLDPISILLPGQGGAPPPIILTFQTDSFGNQPAMLINAENGEGFIPFGAWSSSQ
jgi:hypothetical protein